MNFIQRYLTSALETISKESTSEEKLEELL